MTDHREWLQDTRFATSEARSRHDSELPQAIADALLARDASEWQEIFVGRRHPGCEPMAGVLTFMREHGMLTDTFHPAIGEYWRLPSPFDFSR